jgi:hypothetical protein
MKTSATRGFRLEIVTMCTVGIISTRAKHAFSARRLNLALSSHVTVSLEEQYAIETSNKSNVDDKA